MPKYYHIYDKQVDRLLATGRNSRNLKQIKDEFLSYLSADHDDEELERLRKISTTTLLDMYDFELHITNKPEEED